MKEILAIVGVVVLKVLSLLATGIFLCIGFVLGHVVIEKVKEHLENRKAKKLAKEALEERRKNGGSCKCKDGAEEVGCNCPA